MKKLTPWFLPTKKPVRKGVYETKYHLYGREFQHGYSYWDGKNWANSSSSIDSAYAIKDWLEGAIQEKNWRGLAEQPK